MTDMTSCLCSGKADTPQTTENTLHNPTHLERSKARKFFDQKKKKKNPTHSCECLKTVGLLKTDKAIFQLEHPFPLQGADTTDRHISLPQIECSQYFSQGLDLGSLRSGHSVPVSSPYPAPGPSRCASSSNFSNDYK